MRMIAVTREWRRGGRSFSGSASSAGYSWEAETMGLLDKLNSAWLADALAILVAVLAADYLYEHYKDYQHAVKEAPASYGI